MIMCVVGRSVSPLYFSYFNARAALVCVCSRGSPLRSRGRSPWAFFVPGEVAFWHIRSGLARKAHAPGAKKPTNFVEPWLSKCPYPRLWEWRWCRRRHANHRQHPPPGRRRLRLRWPPVDSGGLRWPPVASPVDLARSALNSRYVIATTLAGARTSGWMCPPQESALYFPGATLRRRSSHRRGHRRRFRSNDVVTASEGRHPSTKNAT